MLWNSESTLHSIFDAFKLELQAATSDKDHPFRFLVMVTATEDELGARFAVLRDLSPQLHMLFFTDTRTDKVRQLQEKEQTALVAYDRNSKVQVRIEGKTIVHHQNEVAAKYWEQVPEEGRKAYTPQLMPGQRLEQPKDAHIWPEVMDDRYFTVLEFIPTRVELLKLEGFEHLRAQFVQHNGKWTSSWLAP